MVNKLNVAFFWHQHQPYYRLPNADRLTQPWVRLHGLKDYLDMPLMARRYPGVHLNFNLVPCLVEQLESYASGEVSDRYLDLSAKPAGQLTVDEKREILDVLFHANVKTMIVPFKRYYALHRRVERKSIDEAVKTFSENDFRDIQVWFNLAWLDPMFRNQEQIPKALVAKGENFTEEDKARLLDYEQDILKKIVSTHKDLQDEGLIEITTTPYFHPILPLLCDPRVARESEPNLAMPRTEYRHPEDAEAQIRMGIEHYEKCFGRPPRGMWPSEGSVSPHVVDLISQQGISWIATDEEILSHSLSKPFSHKKNDKQRAKFLYRPYLLEDAIRPLSCIFRDHHLSDLIGFQYHKQNPVNAADDLIANFKRIGEMDLGEEALVSIILDGENCWEFYPDDGYTFLNELYGQLSESKDIRCVTVSEYLEQFPPEEKIRRIFAGSWINHNFHIWIGHHEDITGWEYLKKARDLLQTYCDENRSEVQDDKVRETAWRHLFAAEGSDWFWWYGDDHSSANDPLFDSLFREHLITIYKLLNHEVPEELYKPISTSYGLVREQEKIVHLMTPILDGKVSHYLEWRAAGHYLPQEDGSAMHRASVLIEDVYFGMDLDNVYICLELSMPLQEFFDSGREIRIVQVHPKETEIVLHKREKGQFQMELFVPKASRASLTWFDIAVDENLEMKLPWRYLGCEDGEEFRFRLRVLWEGHEVEAYPVGRTLAIPFPDKDYNRKNWIV